VAEVVFSSLFIITSRRRLSLVLNLVATGSSTDTVLSVNGTEISKHIVRGEEGEADLL
jgi:hypothetical protein